MRKQVEEWLHFAEIDLLSARKLLEDAYLTQSAAFHIHQSVEKCFKALIENLNLRIPSNRQNNHVGSTTTVGSQRVPVRK